MITVQDQRVEFLFFRPHAQNVFLAGDFNEWRQGDLPMAPQAGGYWRAELRLPPGEFRFRYCADGAWYTDYAASGIAPGRFGLDSVVCVKKPKPAVAAPVQFVGAAVA